MVGRLLLNDLPCQRITFFFLLRLPLLSNSCMAGRECGWVGESAGPIRGRQGRCGRQKHVTARRDGS